MRGELRPVSVSDLSSSVQLITPEDSVAKVNHLEEVISKAANVNYASGSSRARYYQIRGIGERGQFIEPINPSVGSYTTASTSVASGPSRTFLM